MDTIHEEFKAALGHMSDIYRKLYDEKAPTPPPRTVAPKVSKRKGNPDKPARRSMVTQTHGPYAGAAAVLPPVEHGKKGVSKKSTGTQTKARFTAPPEYKDMFRVWGDQKKKRERTPESGGKRKHSASSTKRAK